MAPVAYLAAMGAVATALAVVVAAAGASVADGSRPPVVPSATRIPSRVVPPTATAVPVVVGVRKLRALKAELARLPVPRRGRRRAAAPKNRRTAAAAGPVTAGASPLGAGVRAPAAGARERSP